MQDEFLIDGPVEPVVFSSPVAGAGGLREVVISPAGDVKSTKGSYVMNESVAEGLISTFDEHAVSVPIDFEHESIHSRYAPAAGWVERLYFSAGRGLMGLVKWNQKARAVLSADEYRFLSPAFLIERATGRPVRLDSVALTNKPAIAGAPRLALSRTSTERKETMSVHAEDAEQPAAMEILKKVRDMLGMAGASLEEVLAAVLKIVSEDRSGKKDHDSAELVANARGEMEAATAEQKMGELRAVLEGKGVKITDQWTFIDILSAAMALLQGKKLDDEGNVVANSRTDYFHAGVETEVPEAVRHVLKMSGGDGGVEILALSDRSLDQFAPGDHETMRVYHRAIELREELTEYSDVVDGKQDGWRDAVVTAAWRDWDTTKMFLGALSRCMPPSGRTIAPSAEATTRVRTIDDAREMFREDSSVSAMTSLRAFCNLFLSETGQGSLADDEATRIGA